MVSSGPNNPASNADHSTTWADETNAYSDPSSGYTEDILSAGGNSGKITFYNFGFSIPSNAIINGIKTEVSYTDVVGNVTDLLVQLTDDAGATNDGDNKAATQLGNQPSYRSYGGSSDDWSAGYGVSTINDSNFGVSLQFHNPSATLRVIRIYHVRMTVYYTAPMASGQVVVSGSATATYTATRPMASGQVVVSGSATGSVFVSAGASGQVVVSGSATGSIYLAGEAQGGIVISGSAVASVFVSAGASGQVVVSGSAKGRLYEIGAKPYYNRTVFRQYNKEKNLLYLPNAIKMYRKVDT